MATLKRRQKGVLPGTHWINATQAPGKSRNWWDTAGATFIPAYDLFASGDDLETQALADTRDYIGQRLSGYALDYWNSLSDSQKNSFINDSAYTSSGSGEGSLLDIKDLFGDLFGSTKETDIDAIIADLNSFGNVGDVPTAPDLYDVYDEIMSGNDPIVNDLLNQLSEDTARQTDFYKTQLAENNVLFDDYRSQILGNQYQKNTQLMDTYQSEMSRARRNALEAGASAGLRMAENINTTLATQNKQAQVSLETSNQLAQQLLNQRQAAAGIRGEYNKMLNDASSRKQNIYQQGTQTRYDYYDKQYQSDLGNWESQFDSTRSPFANSMKEYVRKRTTPQTKYSQSTN